MLAPMMTIAAPSLADRFTISLKEMREEMAAQSTRKGPAGALLAAILSLLEALVVLLAEFKAGTLGGHGALAAAVPSRPAASATCAASATSAEAAAACAPPAAYERAAPGAATLPPAGASDAGSHQFRGQSQYLANGRSGDAGPDRGGSAAGRAAAAPPDAVSGTAAGAAADATPARVGLLPLPRSGGGPGWGCFSTTRAVGRARGAGSRPREGPFQKIGLEEAGWSCGHFVAT
jgi:hypothetical protein